MLLSPLSGKLDSDTFGAKAANLALMMRRGFPVPDGCALSVEAFDKYYITTNDDRELRAAITAELHRIGAETYMVRSSAIGEDSADHSFAGQLESFISSNSPDEIMQLVRRCWQSYHKDNVRAYESFTGKKLRGMGVVIQRLIAPDYAGVIFTRSHLRAGHHLLVEYVEGHGEALVSGAVTPKSFHYSPESGSDDASFLPALTEGLHIAQRIEQFYKNPTDIEWALKDGNFYVLQARPITTTLKNKEIYWSNTNVNENYPDPITPLLYSIARESYYHYFKNLSKLFRVPDATIRALEPAFANVIGTFGCKMYYNMSSIHAILSGSPFAGMLIQSFDNFVGYADGAKSAAVASTFQDKLAFVREFLRRMAGLEESVREFESLADAFTKRVAEAITYEDHRTCFHTFIELRMHSWHRASLADFFAMAFHGLLGKFCKRYYGEGGSGIQNTLIQAIPGLISSKPIIAMHHIITALRSDAPTYKQFKELPSDEFWQWIQFEDTAAPQLQRITTYLDTWGFRCSGELMLTATTYAESPASFIALLQQYERMPEQNPEEIIDTKARESRSVLRTFITKIYSDNRWNLPKAITNHFLLNFLLSKASMGIAARERVRLKQAHVYFGLKKVLQRIDEEFLRRGLVENPGDALFLTYQEIGEHLAASGMIHKQLRAIIQTRKVEFKETSAQRYPDDFYTDGGYYHEPDDIIQKSAQTHNSKQLTGLCACGGVISGRVKVLASVLEAGKLEKGDILVTRQTDPGWVVVFPLIRGLIVERGGMLSHGAIVSREFGIPALVGVENATSLLKDGDMIILDAGNGIITIQQQQ